MDQPGTVANPARRQLDIVVRSNKILCWTFLSPRHVSPGTEAMCEYSFKNKYLLVAPSNPESRVSSTKAVYRHVQAMKNEYLVAIFYTLRLNTRSFYCLSRAIDYQ